EVGVLLRRGGLAKRRPERFQALPRNLRVRMVRAEPSLPNGQRPLIVLSSSHKISLAPKKGTEVVQASGGVRVLRAENLFADLQRPLEVRAGSRKISLTIEKGAKVVQAQGGVRVLLAQGLFLDR